MTPGAIWIVGLGQLVNWGVLYYAFGVLLVPLERDLGAPRWVVAGAFSAGLLTSAMAAPWAGRLVDRGQGPVVMQAGGLVSAGLLIAWALVPTIWMTYLVWVGLGLCMAVVLYEPVFAMVGRAVADPDARLRAIATVTVMGGLASTVFLPGASWLATRFGWRSAVGVLAAILALTTVVVARRAFGLRGWDHLLAWRAAARSAGAPAHDGTSTAMPARGPDPRLTATFAMSSVVNAAVASNIVAALIDRRMSASMAAAVGGLFGVMQVPGRLLMTHRAFLPGPAPLLVASFALQIAGLLALMAGGTGATLAGVAVFASGAGLTTLARPYLVLHLYGAAHAGRINGVIARGQQLARAVGPVSAAALAAAAGYTTVFAALAAMLLTATAVTPTRREE